MGSVWLRVHTCVCVCVCHQIKTCTKDLHHLVRQVKSILDPNLHRRILINWSDNQVKFVRYLSRIMLAWVAGFEKKMHNTHNPTLKLKPINTFAAWTLFYSHTCPPTLAVTLRLVSFQWSQSNLGNSLHNMKGILASLATAQLTPTTAHYTLLHCVVRKI